MPTSSLHLALFPAPLQTHPKAGPRPRLLARALCLLVFGVSGLALPASAQTLARPGWAGSGLNADPWWKQAVFYQINPGEAAIAFPAAPPTTKATTDPAVPPAESEGPHPNPTPGLDYPAIAARLANLKALGVDALLLPMPVQQADPAAPPAPNALTTNQTAAPLQPGPQLDAFDQLINEASRQSIRVVLNFPAASLTPDLPATARFWLNRGVAGFHLITPSGTSPENTQAIVQALRKVTNTGVGQRIVIGDFDSNASATPFDNTSAATMPALRTLRGKPAPPVPVDHPQLQIDARLNRLDLPEAANLRAMLVQSMEQSNILMDIHPPIPTPGSPAPYPPLAKVLAAVLLTTHPAALLGADEKIGLHIGERPDSLAAWYRSLSALHHANAALRYGTSTLLNFDEQNALVWVNRPPANALQTAPIVVACNLSPLPVQIALAGPIHALDMRGTYLRTILRSDDSFGPQDINAVILPPYGVYIGELHR
jgi:glycosidase